MKKILLLSLLFCIIVILSSCGDHKKLAAGLEDKIYVIADSAEYDQLFPVLDSVFGKVMYTPQPEKTFDLIRRDYYLLEDLKSLKNIIIVAPLNSSSIVSRYVNSILDSNVKAKVESDSEFVFNKYDLWAQNQLVMVLTAPTIDQLKEHMSKNSDNLLYYFQKISNKRLSQNLYNDKYEQKEIEAKLLKDYGWMIYVQTDYLLALDKPEDNFVWLRRSPGTDMERWIFVHWIENASPEFLHPDSIIQERNRLTEKFYRTSDEKSFVKVAENYMTTNEVNFLDRYALATQGLWEMVDKSMGGPFINYTFYDETTRRIYMLDGAIYAPKYFKKALIQQVDITLQSFLTEKQISEKRKQELFALINEK